MNTKFRCTSCWESYECDENGKCVNCGADMHRCWPWNKAIVGCPVTGEFSRYGCTHIKSMPSPNQPVEPTPTARQEQNND